MVIYCYNDSRSFYVLGYTQTSQHTTSKRRCMDLEMTSKRLRMDLEMTSKRRCMDLETTSKRRCMDVVWTLK